MTDAGRRARFAQETKPSRLVTEVSLADDLQGHRTSQIDVERLVSNPHRAATQFDRLTSLVGHQFVVLEPIGVHAWVLSRRGPRQKTRRIRHLYRGPSETCTPDRIPPRRKTRCRNPDRRVCPLFSSA